MNFNFKWNDFHFLVLLFLFFSLITSNHFLIFNEETVVAICFISFIAFSFQFFGQSVQESLDERNIAIKTELNQALVLEQKYCQEIMYEHKAPIKKMGAFILMAKHILSAKLQWYRHFRQQSLTTFFEQSLKKLVDTKLNFRVRQMNLSKKVFEEKWLHLMASEFEASVLSEFQTTNNEKFQEVLFAQSIAAVQKELSYKK
uniref:ATP synthase F0 subunit b n=1 Tax=Tetraselmis marina TaxID=41888 RepID=UPI0021824795|nr:ATP synthase F0 subunit b [Tetraselmis marina]UVF37915.1 ATP synthase F0 subunit b [Tetraselmis marina]